MTPSPDNLQRLLERFTRMGENLLESRAWISERDAPDSSSILARAETYQRCARELERTLDGETPPEPGQEWREK